MSHRGKVGSVPPGTPAHFLAVCTGGTEASEHESVELVRLALVRGAGGLILAQVMRRQPTDGAPFRPVDITTTTPDGRDKIERSCPVCRRPFKRNPAKLAEQVQQALNTHPGSRVLHDIGTGSTTFIK